MFYACRLTFDPDVVGSVCTASGKFGEGRAACLVGAVAAIEAGRSVRACINVYAVWLLIIRAPSGC